MTTALRTDSSGNTGAISFKTTDVIQLAAAGATLTGVPRAPTAAQGMNTTQIATTEFVTTAVNAVTANNPSPSNSAPIADGASAVPGISVLYSRSDHVHPQFTSPSNSTPSANAGAGSPGVSPNFARADHAHPAVAVPAASDAAPQAVGNVSPGVATTYSRGDHVHPQTIFPATTTPLADAVAGAVGTGTAYARNDHVHPQFTNASAVLPAANTAVGAVGSSNNFARADHSHPAGAQSLGTSGYVTLPGGLIMQWGTNVFTPAGAAVSFPIPFPNAIFNITLGIGDNSNPPVAVASTGAPTNSGFIGHCSQTFNCAWMALGR